MIYKIQFNKLVKIKKNSKIDCCTPRHKVEFEEKLINY